VSVLTEFFLDFALTFSWSSIPLFFFEKKSHSSFFEPIGFCVTPFFPCEVTPFFLCIRSLLSLLVLHLHGSNPPPPCLFPGIVHVLLCGSAFLSWTSPPMMSFFAQPFCFGGASYIFFLVSGILSFYTSNVANTVSLETTPQQS